MKQTSKILRLSLVAFDALTSPLRKVFSLSCHRREFANRIESIDLSRSLCPRYFLNAILPMTHLVDLLYDDVLLLTFSWLTPELELATKYADMILFHSNCISTVNIIHPVMSFLKSFEFLTCLTYKLQAYGLRFVMNVIKYYYLFGN